MSVQVTENPIIMDLTDTFGAMLVGQFLSCAVWGINCVQMFWYFSVYLNDPLSMKLLVVFLWIMDTADHILMLDGSWKPTISRWGSVAELGKLPTVQSHHVWTTAVVGATVQLFFIRRVFFLSGRKWLLSIVLCFLCLYQVVGTIVFLVLLFRNGTLAFLGTPMMIAIQISIRACTMAADVGISVSIILFLLKGGIPKWTSSRQLIFRLIIVTINTNLWTAIAAAVDFSLLASRPNDLLFCIMENVLSALYVSSFLANLNTRRFVAGSQTTMNEFLSAMPDEVVRDVESTVVFGKFSGGSSTAMGSGEEGAIGMVKMNPLRTADSHPVVILENPKSD